MNQYAQHPNFITKEGKRGSGFYARNTQKISGLFCVVMISAKIVKTVRPSKLQLGVPFHQVMLSSAERSELRYMVFPAIAAFYQVDASAHSDFTSEVFHYLIAYHSTERCFLQTIFANKLHLLGTARCALPEKQLLGRTVGWKYNNTESSNFFIRRNKMQCMD